MYGYPKGTPPKQPKPRSQGGGLAMKYYPDAEPFHCRCSIREAPFLPPKERDHWGVPLTLLATIDEIENKDKGGCGPRPENEGVSGPTDPGLGEWEQCVGKLRHKY